MLKLARNNCGVMHERTLIAALIIIAISVGISQYQKHGILGFILGFLITVAGVVAAVFALIGLLDRIGYLHDRLHKKAWYKNTLKISGLILIFLFLSLWATALMGIATLRSGNSEKDSGAGIPRHRIYCRSSRNSNQLVFKRCLLA